MNAPEFVSTDSGDGVRAQYRTVPMEWANIARKVDVKNGIRNVNYPNCVFEMWAMREVLEQIFCFLFILFGKYSGWIQILRQILLQTGFIEKSMDVYTKLLMDIFRY